jgi:copper chaperone NosL
MINDTKKITRRTLLKYSLSTGALLTVSSSFPPFLMAQPQTTGIEHPLKNPKKYTEKGRCPNCGMMLNMWARTRHEFSNSDGTHATCSLRCLADMSNNSGEKPGSVQVALYLHPEKMVAADKAFYVIGSSAKGTMTMKSKIAFLTDKEAANFVAEYGGKVVDFSTALAAATKELPMSRPKIEGKRKKMGKISDPSPDTRCTVCGMYPARFPAHRCQVATADGKHHHFCSSQCLVNFTANPEKYLKKPAKIKSIWVTVYPDGGYEYAMGLYYLVGSNILGPMGKEALPYRSKVAAEESAKKNGGTVLHFKALSPAAVMGK